MIIKMDFEADHPIYRQLVDAIKEGIATRQLEPNEALPSVRSFAADLGINMHTVNKAYQILKNDGFLLIHRQKGVVINPQLPGADQAFLDKCQNDLKTLVTEAVCREMDEAAFMKMCQSLFHDLKEKRGNKR
ncbi:GntR family transcriptional regulator [Scopulibacillus darangshiensis]|uniref:GntR family transcriptional regulator n=1 Tax=Scopulibacillus darangshiensis TaxID=442528 RepID=A0A4R2PD00_9BACL|nr:GntR family transcriptional regulator [Scopulibacillus darangshiensis]TCP31795.1 GntR family transcriptional regulator [Scopulibacillus darangshiensis]